MPAMDGFEAITRILADDPAAHVADGCGWAFSVVSATWRSTMSHPKASPRRPIFRPASPARAALVLLALCLPAIAAAQNLLVNGQFDADLTGWSIVPVASPPIWDDVDIDDWIGSGGARVTNTSPDALNRIFPLEQCIRPTASGRYRVIAHGYIPSGQDGGKLVVNYSLSFSATDCTLAQGAHASGGEFLTTIDGWGRYDKLIPLPLSSPVPADAMLRVRLGVEKDNAGGSFHGFFDAVQILRDPVIFSGDFE